MRVDELTLGLAARRLAMLAGVSRSEERTTETRPRLSAALLSRTSAPKLLGARAVGCGALP